jgi:hypothetical protein
MDDGVRIILARIDGGGRPTQCRQLMAASSEGVRYCEREN